MPSTLASEGPAMVTKAGWAVIADLHEMIPAITEEVKKRKR